MSTGPAAESSPERSALAWRRTTLSLAVLALVTTRVAAQSGGVAPAVVGAVAVVLGAWVVLVTTRRSLWTTLRHDVSGLSVLRDGRLPAAVTTVAVVMAVVVMVI